jgi:hypothetical protein
VAGLGERGVGGTDALEWVDVFYVLMMGLEAWSSSILICIDFLDQRESMRNIIVPCSQWRDINCVVLGWWWSRMIAS